MVLDLKLPDGSGYDLLEKMAASERLPFPPVIVYTGRALTRDEEQRLRRYSRSIIIKGARSPERLLDEVTLFLHQRRVEAAAASSSACCRRRASATRCSRAARILLAEDDVRNIFALTSVFEPLGAKLEIARNGREALERARARRHRPRADGHHDAGDGRPRRRCASIRARPAWQRAADHRAHRQGDARRPRALPARPAPTTTSPSRSTSTSCVSLCRVVDAAVTTAVTTATTA